VTKKLKKFKKFHLLYYKNKEIYKSISDDMWCIYANNMVYINRKHIDLCVKIIKYYGRLTHYKIQF